MGFLKKLKDVPFSIPLSASELGKKGIEKGAELGTKAYDAGKDAAQKGIDKAREDK